MNKPGCLHWKALWVMVVLACMVSSCGRVPQPLDEMTMETPGEVLPTGQSPDDLAQGDPNTTVDLIAATVTVDPDGDPGRVKVHVSVRDKGAGQVASDFSVVWYPHVRSGEVGCRWDILPAQINHEKQELDCTYTYPVHGDMNWRLDVDSENTVSESDERNNHQRGPISIVSSGVEKTLAAPSNCGWRVTAAPGEVLLTWDYSGPSGIAGFVIYMGATRVVQWVEANIRQVLIQDLNLDKQVHFDVRAYQGNSQSPLDACSVDAATGQ